MKETDISDLTLLRASSNKSNLLMTLSPPCPSWRQEGKHSGLATDEGFCFLDAIEHVARARPVLALVECSDGIEAHPHWRVLSAAMQLAGYCKLWSQDVAIRQLTSNHRSRWLAVWSRHDVPGQKLHERFVCSINRRLSWNDAKHQHALPNALADDLVLHPPKCKSMGIATCCHRQEGPGRVMMRLSTQRLVPQGECLPTLCASYTAQHLLQKEHLESKGIFATLTQQNDRFSFIDPFVFVVLFGTTDSIALPTALRTAFHQLGNAISQIHALVVILFAIEGVTFQKLSLIQQCWEDRLTTDKAMIRICDDVYVLQPLADFVAKAIPSVVTWQPWPVDHTLIRFCDDATLIPLNITETLGVVAQLLSSLDLADHHAHLIHLIGDGGALPGDVSWRELPMGDLIVKMGSLDLRTIRVMHTHSGDCTEDPIVSPTQPWHEEDADPELIIYRMPIELASSMLQSMFARMKTHGRWPKFCYFSKMVPLNGSRMLIWTDLEVYRSCTIRERPSLFQGQQRCTSEPAGCSCRDGHSRAL